MNDDLFSRDFSSSSKRQEPPERDNLFLWTILILLLIGLALACWLGSFYIFGHPEKPDSYRILQKLHKLEPSRRFEVTQAPPGEFLSPQKAFERYSAMSHYQLEQENEAMIRDYINNFQATKRLVPYITGRYTIMSSHELKSADFFGSGVVALGQSVDFPQALIEHVYTAPARTVPLLNKMLVPGLDIKLEKTLDLSAIVHIARLFDGRLQFTVVPLLYGSYAIKDSTGSIGLEPPPILNPAGGLPIIRGSQLDEALKAYAEQMRKRVGARVAAGGTPGVRVAQPASKTTIVRVDTAPTPSPIPGAKPAQLALPAEAAPTPVPGLAQAENPSTPAQESASGASQAVVSGTGSTLGGAATPSEAIGGGSSGALASGTVKVALVPFLAPTPSPTPGVVVAASSGGTWRTYPPGRMPRGRLVSVGDASELAERGAGGERLYLRGNFVVTAVVGNKATLRPNSGALANAFASMRRRSEARVIVEFPPGVKPPAEGATVSRDELRPFELRDVRKTNDGQLNVFVREVTTP